MQKLSRGMPCCSLNLKILTRWLLAAYDLHLESRMQDALHIVMSNMQNLVNRVPSLPVSVSAPTAMLAARAQPSVCSPAAVCADVCFPLCRQMGCTCLRGM